MGNTPKEASMMHRHAPVGTISVLVAATFMSIALWDARAVTVLLSLAATIVFVGYFLFASAVRTAFEEAHADRDRSSTLRYREFPRFLNVLFTGHRDTPYATLHADRLATQESAWSGSDIADALTVATDPNLPRESLRELVARAHREQSRDDLSSAEQTDLQAFIDTALVVFPWVFNSQRVAA